MNEEQNIKNTFFQPCIEELAFSRSMSNCSFFANCQMDLNLDIEDVVDFDHEDLQNYQFPLDDRDISFVFPEVSEKFSSKEINPSVEIQKKSTESMQMEPSVDFEGEKPVEQIPKKNKKMAKNDNKEKTPKTFYEKNICRNITRKVIRMIEAGTYKDQLIEFCQNKEEFYKEFSRIMSSHLEMITGPAALREFLQVEDAISSVFRKFMIWYLKERYIRDAINGGHMTNIDKYISYKNEVLLPIIEKS